MAVKKVYLTKEGARVSAFCQNNAIKVNFLSAGLGSGENYNPSEATKMTDEKLVVPIQSCKRIESNHFKIRAEFSNDILEEDLIFREVCLYCDDPENNGEKVMYCYGNAKTDDYDYSETIPAFTTSGNASTRIVEIDTYVQGDNATFFIDHSAKADIATVQELREDLEQEIEDRAEQDNSILTKLDKEITDRQNADGTLQTVLEQEIENRENADTTLQANIDKKVDKENGKGLSTNDFTTEEKNKLAELSNYDDTSLRNEVDAEISEINTKLGYKADASHKHPVYENTVYFCSISATTSAKTLTISGFSLVKGACVRICFSNGNNVASSTLNVNGTGAKEIRVMRGGTKIPLGSKYGDITNGASWWDKGTILELMYDGTYWVAIGNPIVKQSTSETQSYKIYLDGYKDVSIFVNRGSDYEHKVTLPFAWAVSSTMVAVSDVSDGLFAIGGNICLPHPASENSYSYMKFYESDMSSTSEISVGCWPEAKIKGNVHITGYAFQNNWFERK